MANLEFKELNAQELEEVNGGNIWWALAFTIAYDLITDWKGNVDSFKKGMEDGLK